MEIYHHHQNVGQQKNLTDLLSGYYSKILFLPKQDRNRIWKSDWLIDWMNEWKLFVWKWKKGKTQVPDC